MILPRVQLAVLIEPGNLPLQKAPPNIGRHLCRITAVINRFPSRRNQHAIRGKHLRMPNGIKRRLHPIIAVPHCAAQRIPAPRNTVQLKQLANRRIRMHHGYRHGLYMVAIGNQRAQAAHMVGMQMRNQYHNPLRALHRLALKQRAKNRGTAVQQI